MVTESGFEIDETSIQRDPPANTGGQWRPWELIAMGPSKIIKEVYLGSWYDAAKHGDKFDWVINVADPREFSNQEMQEMLAPKRPIHVLAPVLQMVDGDEDHWAMDMTRLGKISQLISEHFHEKMLIHCAAGVERSPLVLAYVLRYIEFDHIASRTWDEAYTDIESKRPQIQRRIEWMPMEYRNEK